MLTNLVSRLALIEQRHEKQWIDNAADWHCLALDLAMIWAMGGRIGIVMSLMDSVASRIASRKQLRFVSAGNGDQFLRIGITNHKKKHTN